MDWSSIGKRIRTQREFMGYTREQFAELLDVTPKFCSDIKLGVKGMSIPTLCKISKTLRLSTEYILYGKTPTEQVDTIPLMLQSASPTERYYAEMLLTTFFRAMDAKKDQSLDQCH